MEEANARAVFESVVPVGTSPMYSSAYSSDLRLVPGSRGPAVIEEASRTARPYERYVKPALDRAVAGLVFVVLLPFMALIAMAVRMTMGPSVIFRQKRVGYKGHVIEVLKFRSMHHDRRAVVAEGYSGLERRFTHKSKNNPLVTPLGRVLRKLSLDELPQLWNVLRGDMSLVGPRPQLVALVDEYEPWALQRHNVKPGLTGLWQVKARRTQPMEECIDLDLEYIQRVSLVTDLRILLLTVPAVLWKPPGY